MTCREHSSISSFRLSPVSLAVTPPERHFRNWTLGTVGNTIAGAIGGVACGQLVAQLMPALANTAGNVDVSALVGQIVGGGFGGAIFAVIAGLTKWMVVPPKST